MGDPHFGSSGAWFFLSVGLIPIAAALAAFLAWWAHREQSQWLVKFAASVLIGPWILLMLLSGLGAAAAMLLFIPTSWLSPAVGIALAIVSRKVRRKESEAQH